MKFVLTPHRVAVIPLCSLLLNLAFWMGGAAGANSYAHETATPIQKIVKLLQTIQGKGRQEKAAEKVQFAAYKQFCEDTVGAKKQSVADAGEAIDELKADIEKYGTDSNTLAKEAADLEADVAAATGDVKAITKVREIEKVDYQKTYKDYSQSVKALRKAISVVKKKAVDKKQVSKKKAVLRQVASLGHIPDEARHAMVAFIQGQASPLDTKAPAKKKAVLRQVASLGHIPDEARHAMVAFIQGQASPLDRKAPEAYAYEAQSEGVIEMLQRLLDKFLGARANLEKEETAAQNAFQLLMRDLKRQLQRDKANIVGKKQVRAKKLKSKAEAERSLTDTLKARASDTKYVDDLVVTCEKKATDFVKRQALRSDELDAIQKAIEIISGDSVTSSAGKLGLLEGDVAEDTEVSLAVLHSELQSRARLRVASYLRSRAADIDSPVLSVLALHVGSDPFGKVKKLVHDLIVRLMAEANEEADHKGWCDSELATNEQTRREKTKAVEALHAEIDSLEASVAKLNEDSAALSKAVAELNAAVEQATRLRQAEKAKNQQVTDDAKAAQTAVTQALAVLKNFYAKAGEATALLQAPRTFSKPYKGQDMSGGVIKMLEVVTSDFAKLEASTKAAEAAAQSEYDKFMTDSKMNAASKAKDLEHKTSKRQNQLQALTQKKDDVEGTQKELDAALTYFDKLKPSCVDSGVTYEQRVARRNAEIKSLQDALRILIGQDVPGI
eukprot:CAMPEP_0172929868 /NCGR_PEP_ID=MMETSP1075-20121228/218701_1 /TAXON_ID=2916 /ORGANISM="Ceratium fusus, Strain PA161109" /LENGTH=726 /DNA_ID=CAMNT_0013791173 /DNA_START=84 /DNA_END=2264 /DNA_ORIENTATION=-